MLPRFLRLKTSMGKLLSLHKEIAVVSMTFNPRFMTSKYLIELNFLAFLSFNGSDVYTPSTLVAFNITWALISKALKAAAVSVVK